MKNLFFALLACLLTACFRAPHFTSLSMHSPAAPGSEVAPPLPPDREVYAASDPVAGAGTAPRKAGEAFIAPPARPAYVTEGNGPGTAANAGPTPQSVNRRRELRKAIRTALRARHPAAATLDNPAPVESGLPTAAFIAGLVGAIALLLSPVALVNPIGLPLVLLAFLGGLLGIILGGIAKGRIRRGQDAESGRSKASAGLILGIVNLSVMFLVIALAVLLLVALVASGWSFNWG